MPNYTITLDGVDTEKVKSTPDNMNQLVGKAIADFVRAGKNAFVSVDDDDTGQQVVYACTAIHVPQQTDLPDNIVEALKAAYINWWQNEPDREYETRPTLEYAEERWEQEGFGYDDLPGAEQAAEAEYNLVRLGLAALIRRFGSLTEITAIVGEIPIPRPQPSVSGT